MPEGHVIHRQARALREAFPLGYPLQVSSPQGRFAASARLIDGAEIAGLIAHGKHLFIGFNDIGVPPAQEPGSHALEDSGPLAGELEAAEREDWRWVHVHLGLYGKWRMNLDLAGQCPEPVGEVRLRLKTDSAVADLSGPNRCELIDYQQVREVISRLGPDPLINAPGDRGAFVRGARGRARRIGELVMDQATVSGPGNIYRAECLFRVGISPFRLGRNTSAKRLERLWDDLVVSMERGRREGIIRTIDDEDAPATPIEGDEELSRFYVYHRTGRPCVKCGSTVKEMLMAHRRLFWCPGCQR